MIPINRLKPCQSVLAAVLMQKECVLDTVQNAHGAPTLRVPTMTMVTYDFLPRFIEPIRVGLGYRSPPPRAKRQTVRSIAERSHHAHPGDQVALYVKRHDYSELIGVAICVDSLPINIHLDPLDPTFGCVVIEGRDPIAAPTNLDEFACDDGFDSWTQMASYLRTRYALYSQPMPFRGLLIRWRPIDETKTGTATQSTA